MNKLLLFSLWAIATSALSVNLDQPTTVKETKKENISKIEVTKDPIRELYNEMKLSSVLKYEAFEQAMQGYNQIHPKNQDIITVIDFTLPSTEKRMFVLDLKAKKLLFHNIVSHGRNSGEKYATSFSNKHGSFQSSLGFYLTQETYNGGNGFSLRLNGLEKGINDQARPRAIVIHGADYCSTDVIKSTGRLGRSYGCPALPRELTKPIINSIKDGTLLYIYSQNKEYIASSKMIKKITPNQPENTMIAAQQEEEASHGKAIMN